LNDLEQRLRRIRLLAMDVDGVLTDGSIVWGVDSTGSLTELKAFNVKDGLAISMARTLGIEVAWITGRVSPIVERRAAELKVTEVCQWARNKRLALGEIAERLHVTREEILYIGDDLNDLPAFDVSGVTVAVADAVGIVRERADWVTEAPGGRAAVREVIERVLHAQGRWDEAVEAFLARLEAEQGRPPGGAAAAQ
jgi:3-deoxy-D-manno-octulosonate 8-phosphate phosphatase (KDO 8-P phosphatase)